MDNIASKMMTHKEAKECVNKINSGMNNIRQLIVDLYEREGWFAMGYKNWTECVQKEFKQHERYVFYQYKAAEIEQNISNCTNVQLGNIPEGQLRPLAKLEPEQQREAWKKAVETAPEGKVTAAHVSKVVKEMAGPAKNKEEPPKTRMVSEAMGIAEFAIVHLERIRPGDPDRNEALQKVIRWCEIKIGGKNGR